MAKNLLHSIGSFCGQPSLAAYAFALLSVCPLGYAQQAETDTNASTEVTAGSASDGNTVAALPATERLAIQARQLLAQAGDTPSPVWLTIEDGEVLAFWQEDMSGSPVGALLMLHAEGHSPRWPATMLNMHQALPKFGWSTLSVELPPPAARTIPTRPAVVQPAPEAASGVDDQADAEKPEKPENTEPEDGAQQQALAAEVAQQDIESEAPDKPTEEEVEQAALATIAAAVDYLHQQGQQNIAILGEGLGGLRALKYLAQNSPTTSPTGGPSASSIRALVLLDPTLPEAEQAAALLTQPELPTLDLITSTDFRERAVASQRRQLSRKMRYQTYVLRRILPSAGTSMQNKENDISRAVRGFLSRHAAGKEVPAPRP